MARSFSTSKTYVGGFIGDTDASFAVLIGQDYNRLYEDIWQRIDWSEAIDNDNTFESVVGTAEYALPSSFEKEIFLTNIATGKPIKPSKIGEWWRDESDKYSADSIDNGTVDKYVILEESGMIQLDPPPDTAETYALPYKLTFTALTADDDVPLITGIDKIIENGCLGLAYERKQLHGKGSFYLQKYEIALARRIRQERARGNYRYQMVPEKKWFGRRINRLTGDQSYDSI